MIFKDICLSDSTLLLVYTVPKYLPAPTVLVILPVLSGGDYTWIFSFFFYYVAQLENEWGMVHWLIFYLVERKHKALHHSLQM
jgi:hypothetical protein